MNLLGGDALSVPETMQRLGVTAARNLSGAIDEVSGILKLVFCFVAFRMPSCGRSGFLPNPSEWGAAA